MAKTEARNQLRLAKAKREITALYQLKPQCFTSSQTRYFYSTPEEHFTRDTNLKSLENWIVTYAPMIRQEASVGRQLQTGEMGFGELVDVPYLLSIS